MKLSKTLVCSSMIGCITVLEMQVANLSITVMQGWAKCGPPRSFVRPDENIFQHNQLVFDVKCNFHFLDFQKGATKGQKKF